MTEAQKNDPHFVSFDGQDYNLTHEPALVELLGQLKSEGSSISNTGTQDDLRTRVAKSLVPILGTILRGLVCKIDALNFTVGELVANGGGGEDEIEISQFEPGHQKLLLGRLTYAAALIKGALAQPGIDAALAKTMNEELTLIAEAAAIVDDPDRLLEEDDGDEDEDEDEDGEEEGDGTPPS